jgi:hypothetical protein
LLLLLLFAAALCTAALFAPRPLSLSAIVTIKTAKMIWPKVTRQLGGRTAVTCVDQSASIPSASLALEFYLQPIASGNGEIM